MSHSPTPWEAVEVGADEMFLGVPDGSGGYDPFIDAGDISREFAEHIVRCVNLHDELVKLLDEASYYVALSEGEGCHDAHRLHNDIAILLAKARGE